MARPVVQARANFARKLRYEDAGLALEPLYYLRLKEGHSIANDAMGNHHGAFSAAGVTKQLASPIPGDARWDYCVELNGSSGYITVADAAAIDDTTPDTFWYSGLLKRDATGVKHYLVQKGTGSAGIYVGTDNKLTLEKVGTADIVKSSSTLDTGWHSWFISKTGATVRMEIDGLNVLGTVTNQTIVNTATTVTWGRDSASANYFDGRVDELMYGTGSIPSTIATNRLAVALLFGELGGPYDDFSAYLQSASIKTGRNGMRTAAATGTLGLGLANETHWWTAERNLSPIPGFASGLHGLQVSDFSSHITPATAAPTWVTGGHPDDPDYSCQISLAVGEGVWLPIRGYFDDTSSITAEIAMKSISGDTSMEVFIGSEGTPAEVDDSASTITGSWATYDVTLTLGASVSDLGVGIRNAGAGPGVVQFGRIQVNRGATAHDWLLAPTWWQLQPGALAQVQASYLGTIYPLFAGHLGDSDEHHGPSERNVEIAGLDWFDDLALRIEFFAGQKTHYDARVSALGAAVTKLSGSYENWISNSALDTADTTGWTLGGTANHRSANPSELPSTTGSIRIPGNSTLYWNQSGTAFNAQIASGSWVTISWYSQLASGSADVLNVLINTGGGSSYTVSTGTLRLPTVTGSWQRYTVYALLNTVPVDEAEFSIRFSCASNDVAKGVDVAGLMVTAGLRLRDWTPIGEPVGRRAFNYLDRVTESPDYWLTQVGLAYHCWGFDRGWSNFCTNPECVSATTGWSGSTNGFITGSGGTVSRITAGGYVGGFATALRVASSANANSGGRFALTGTFYANTRYILTFYCNLVSSSYTCGIGSSGTPADAQSTTASAPQFYSVTWTPSSNRTDAAIWFRYAPAGAANQMFEASGISVTAEGEESTARAYAREGFKSPASLTEATSCSAVDDATLGRKVWEIVTKATAGSGVVTQPAKMPSVLGAKATLQFRAMAPSGSPVITAGVGAPYGQVTATAASTSITLDQTWRDYSVTFTGAVFDLGETTGILGWFAAQAASVTTFRVTDMSLHYGTRLQPFAVEESDGLDPADADIINIVAEDFDVDSALSHLEDLNDHSTAAHWIEALTDWPWFEVHTRARQSRPTQAVAEVIPEGGLTAVTGLGRRRDDTIQIVLMNPGSVSEEYVAATATPEEIDWVGVLQTDWQSPNGIIADFDVAQELVALHLDRRRYAIARPKFERMHTFPEVLERKPDDVIRVTDVASFISGQRYVILSQHLQVSRGDITRVVYDVEEFRG